MIVCFHLLLLLLKYQLILLLQCKVLLLLLLLQHCLLLHHRLLLHDWWKHARLLHNNDWRRRVAFGRFVSIAFLSTIGSPGTLEVEATGLFALVVDREPFIDSSNRAQGRGFDTGLADLIMTFHAFVEDLDNHIVTDILDIDVERFVPLWVLAFHSMRLELIMSVLNLDEGVHTRESRSVSGKACLNDF